MSRDRTTKPGHDGSGGRGAEAHGDVDPLQQARSAVQLAEGLGPMPGVVVAAQQAIADRSYSAALAATRAWMMHKPHVELLARSMDPSDQDVPRAQALLDRMRPLEPKLPRNIFKLGIAELDREDEAEWLALIGAPPKRQGKSSAYAGAHGKLEGNAGLDDGASVHAGHTSDPILDLSPGDIAKGVLVPPWALVKPVRQRVLGADHDPVMGGVDDVLDGLINDTDYLSGFVVGAVQGTQAAIRDCQNAPLDLIKLIVGELKKFALDKHYDVLVRLRDMIKQAPAAIELLGKRWNDDSDRHAQGAFQGEVVGYIGTQLAILIVTSFAGPLAEAFGPYAGVIRAIAAVSDPVSVVREVALGVRLSKDAEMALQAARNAQRVEALAADGAQDAAKLEQGAVRAEQAAARALPSDGGGNGGAAVRANEPQTARNAESTGHAIDAPPHAATANATMDAWGTGAKRGEAPSPESLRVGDVRMELHPDYGKVVAELEAAGFELRVGNKANVALERIVDEAGTVLEYRRYVNVIEGMRFLDLEHELGHVRQLRQLGADPMPTQTLVRRANGSEEVAEGALRKGTMKSEHDSVFEYHNRLQEWVRLAERGAPADLLGEHATGVVDWRKWAEAGGLGRSGGRGTFDRWAREAVPDLPELERRARTLGLDLGRTTWRW